MGMSELQKPRPVENERGAKDLRIYRLSVLESGQNAGNKGKGSALII